MAAKRPLRRSAAGALIVDGRKIAAFEEKDPAALAWADAGHITAYAPVRNSEEFKTKQPNATYSILADTAVFDPSSVLAGVASPVYDAAGNYLMPAVNGEIDPQSAMEQMRDDLQGQVE